MLMIEAGVTVLGHSWAGEQKRRVWNERPVSLDGIGSVGLAFARDPEPRQPRSSTHPMTTTAYAPPQRQFDFDVTADFDLRPSPSSEYNGKARSRVRAGKNAPAMSRASSSGGMERTETSNGSDDASLFGTSTRTTNTSTQPRSWLRRMSSSRDSRASPSSRPSTGSMAFSHSGSTTPIFRTAEPSKERPNKLVKRTASLRSVNSSPLTSTGSRLPMPVFRRPATSHQRSVTMQEQLRGRESFPHVDTADSTAEHDTRFRQYFTPKVPADENAFARRRSSTGIPNPVKRIYPDRRYTPILVSARHVIEPAGAEVDATLSEDEEGGETTRLALASSVASSPLPTQPLHFGQAPTAKRSFSIGDLLSTGPSPLFRRTTQRQGKAANAKLVRKPRARVSSAPDTVMGNGLSRNAGLDAEPPAKRRDLTDPYSARRSLYASPSGNPQLEVDAAQGINLHLASPATASEDPDIAPAPSPHGQNTQPSAARESAASRPIRVSAAHSELTSGSDSESRSIGDASTDYQSDTVYDSYPTRTTRSSSGKRGPHIESIFDDSPPNFSSGKSTKLQDLLSDGNRNEDHARYRHSTIEEEGSVVSTPVRSLRNASVTSTPSARPGAHAFGSSPPTMRMTADPDEIDWDAFDDEGEVQGSSTQQRPDAYSGTPQQSIPFRFGPALQHSLNGSGGITPQRANGEKANLFEWAEVQPSPSHNSSPPRPRTVHGKKDHPDSRGSRATGRRAPSGMHARSHSVPVVPDTDGKRPNAVANKFGTWGVGSKGVTEDWNEDFEFDPAPASSSAETLRQEEKRVDSGHDMLVPRSIREQQENVVANIGLLREWGLLIEELKELRVRAVSLDMLSGPYAHAWYEVDAMIELADQESEEHTLEPRKSPPSSPGFDYEDFEEPLPSIAGATEPLSNTTIPEHEQMPSPSQPTQATETPRQQLPTTRPRKDSEAVARSVIEALQTRRNFSDPAAVRAPPPAKKVPFDTATLRHIVPYVNGLKRKVKDALRETEGLYSSPRRRVSPDTEEARGGPAFRSIFDEPDPETTDVFRRSRREQAATDHDGGDALWFDQQSDLTRRLRKMKLPSESPGDRTMHREDA